MGVFAKNKVWRASHVLVLRLCKGNSQILTETFDITTNSHDGGDGASCRVRMWPATGLYSNGSL